MDVTVRSSRGVHPQSGGRGSEQNRRMACDCRHFQPRPDPSHHGLTEQLRPSVTVRSSRGFDLLRACPLCRPSNQRSVPLPPPSGLGAESGDETRGVGTIWSVRQPCRGVSRLASTLGWPVRGVVSRYVGGSAATPTRCGLIAAGRMPTDRSSTAWPNSYPWTCFPINQPWSLYLQGRRVGWQPGRVANRKSLVVSTFQAC